MNDDDDPCDEADGAERHRVRRGDRPDDLRGPHLVLLDRRRGRLDGDRHRVLRGDHRAGQHQAHRGDGQARGRALPCRGVVGWACPSQTAGGRAEAEWACPKGKAGGQAGAAGPLQAADLKADLEEVEHRGLAGAEPERAGRQPEVPTMQRAAAPRSAERPGQGLTRGAGPAVRCRWK